VDDLNNMIVMLKKWWKGKVLLKFNMKQIMTT